MDIVLSDLAKVFKGQRSQVFVHKGQQLIKAAKVKYNEDHENWIPDNKQPDRHEAEVCRPTTVAEIKGVVARNKDTRASGVDEIPTLLFKNASQRFYEKLILLVNNCLLQGETPSA